MTASETADSQAEDLDEQIDERRSDIRTDKLDITYGEFSSMYEAGELVVAPDYQRLFRWAPPQKARFIESILLGIPTPAIFVAETKHAVWELVDGLQRLSTILEFFGVLKNADGERVPPSRLETDEAVVLSKLDGLLFEELSLRSRLSLRRAGCRVEVVKVGSGRRMKHDLFERLNTGGTQLTDQEIRNCIFRAESPDLMNFFDSLARFGPFRDHLGLSERQQKSLYDRGLVLRFFALKNNIDNFRHHVEPFVTDYVHRVVDGELSFDQTAESQIFQRTMKLIADTLGPDSWKNWRDGKAQGAFSPYIFEALSQTVSKNLAALEALDPNERARRFNALKQDDGFRSAGGPGGNTKPKLLQRLSIADRIVANSSDGLHGDAEDA